MDGAGKARTLFNIIIPNVMPSITICLFLTITNSFKLFDQNLALTAGAPGNKSAMLALDIYKTFKGKIKAVFDPANFIQCGVEILPAYEKLEEYIEYMHVKDCIFETGKVVPAGKGDGQLLELLKRFSKKDGKRILTLEPHLTVFEGLAALEGEGGTADKLKDDFTYPSQAASFDAASEALHNILSQI